MPCREGEGHCRYDDDCHFNTQCAVGAGAKYGLPEGTGVCIPKYNVHQITFWPTLLYKSQPTTMLLVERGKAVIPQNATVRVLQGSNPGCLGVWDRSAPIAAEASLHRQNDHRIRPEGHPAAMDGHCSSMDQDQDLPYSTQPFLKWEGLVLTGDNRATDGLFVDPRYQVCLCDAGGTDCTNPTSWHDLGHLNLEPAASWFISAGGHKATSGYARVGIGGDLYERYREEDVVEYWPEIARLRTSDTEPILHELCAQRCLANPLCTGYDMTDPDWNGGRSKTCSLRGEGHQLQVMAREYVGDASPNFYFRAEPRRQAWHYFPSFNHTTSGHAADFENPMIFEWVQAHRWNGRGCQQHMLGLNATDVPLEASPLPLPDETTERLRQLMLPIAATQDESWTQAHVHVHTGDGSVLPTVVDLASDPYESELSARVAASADDDDYDEASGISFSGGVYFPDQQPTCGGNALGGPCLYFGTFTHNGVWYPSTSDPDILNKQCSVSDGETRPWCFTSDDLTRWGYCDCGGEGWSRPFGRWSSTFNAAYAGGDVVILTDDLHHPITNVGSNFKSSASYHKFGTDTSLCLRFEGYGSSVGFSTSWGGSAEVRCPSGEALSGLAVAGITGVNGEASPRGDPLLVPRCGVPAGWTIDTDEESEELTGAPDDVWYGYDDKWDSMAFTPCSDGHVAVGLEWRSKYSGKASGEIVLICAPFERTDSAAYNATFRRSCEAIVCNGTATFVASADTAEQCLAACEAAADCTAAQFEAVQNTDQDNECHLLSGTCDVSDEPHGKPVSTSGYDAAVETASGPAVFTPVEYEHPTSSLQLADFVVGSVPREVWIKSAAYDWKGTPWSTCSKACETGVQERMVFCAHVANAVSDAAVDDAWCDGAGAKPETSQACNQFSCDAQCVLPAANRSACALYEMDTRKDSSAVEIRESACKTVGCCFVPDPDAPDGMADGALECYAQPHTTYAEWVSLPFKPCSASCVDDPDDEGLAPLRNRRNLCAWINGSAADASRCPGSELKPTSIEQCNTEVECPTCSNFLSESESCGYGKCERIYDEARAEDHTEECSCLEGWGRADASSPCNVDLRADDSANCDAPSWTIEDWGDCTALWDGTFARGREASCSCYDDCDEATKPATSEACTGCACADVPDVSGATLVACDGISARLAAPPGPSSTTPAPS